MTLEELAGASIVLAEFSRFRHPSHQVAPPPERKRVFVCTIHTPVPCSSSAADTAASP